MKDRVASAIEVLQAELGLSLVSVWAPTGDDEAEVYAVFFARDTDALMAAAIDLVTGDKRGS